MASGRIAPASIPTQNTCNGPSIEVEASKEAATPSQCASPAPAASPSIPLTPQSPLFHQSNGAMPQAYFPAFPGFMPLGALPLFPVFPMTHASASTIASSTAKPTVPAHLDGKSQRKEVCKRNKKKSGPSDGGSNMVEGNFKDRNQREKEKIANKSPKERKLARSVVQKIPTSRSGRKYGPDKEKQRDPRHLAVITRTIDLNKY